MIATKYNKSSLLKSISSFSLFEGVPISDLDELIMEGTILNYKKGQKIHREGERSTEFRLILEGMVIFSKVSSTGREFVVDWEYAGWTPGWGQIIEGGCFTATCTALVDTSVISFSKEKFHVLLSRNPIVLKRISDQSVDLINKLFNNLIDVSTDTANNRLIRTLISLCKISGNTLNLTHQEIAQIAWTTIETTTRILSKLKKDKIVSIEHGKMIINNPEKLPIYFNLD
jgi:CRP/FNR family cyclic AMP-dependent transcriptional regulator